MSQPTHEPPDPELWGRVVEIWESMDAKQSGGVSDIMILPPEKRLKTKLWKVSVIVYGGESYRGKGPTMNDAARALIAEWEGRQ
jgi:hypothetical protein